MSPVQTKLPPLTPPNSPPIGKEIYDIQKFEVIKPEYESELSESIDISEEMRQLQGILKLLSSPGLRVIAFDDDFYNILCFTLFLYDHKNLKKKLVVYWYHIVIVGVVVIRVVLRQMVSGK